jgi:hypothetical protein
VFIGTNVLVFNKNPAIARVSPFFLEF